MFSILTIPDTFVTSTLAYVGGLATDLYPILAVVVGLPLGFWVLRKLISLFRG